MRFAFLFLFLHLPTQSFLFKDSTRCHHAQTHKKKITDFYRNDSSLFFTASPHSHYECKQQCARKVSAADALSNAPTASSGGRIDRPPLIYLTTATQANNGNQQICLLLIPLQVFPGVLFSIFFTVCIHFLTISPFKVTWK